MDPLTHEEKAQITLALQDRLEMLRERHALWMSLRYAMDVEACVTATTSIKHMQRTTANALAKVLAGALGDG